MPSTPQQISPSSNIYLDAIQWGGWRWTDGATPGTNITYYFAGAGRTLSGVFNDSAITTSVGWLSHEQTAYQNALQQWSNVANISFTRVYEYSQADLVEFVYNNTTSSILGAHETPEYAASSDGTAWGAYNVSGSGFTSTGLERGGFGFVTLVHEIGHALGLAHPFDDGGGSGIFPGVAPYQFDPHGNPTHWTYGNRDFNQGIFTTMSYNDGWETDIGLSSSNDYGWQGGPMAFDIAAIQDLYGANTSYNSASNNYLLGHVAGFPDVLSCIWDTGGTDGITYGGYYDCTIDLRAATLTDSIGGGGYVSYVNGAPTNSRDRWNAFTIANGVVIEEATGGGGNDSITGNSSNNWLQGRGGIDWIDGQGGWDIADYADRSGINWTFDLTTAYYSDGVYWNTATATGVSSGTEYFRNIEQIIAGDGNDWFYGNSASNEFWGGAGSDRFQAGGGTDYIYGGLGTDYGHFTSNYSAYTVVSVNQSSGQVIVNGPEGYDTFLGVEWFQFADQTIWWQNLGQTGGSSAVANDFNGDGTSDILWHNSTSGGVGQFQMNNGVATWANIGWASTDWQAAGTGDFNGDGTSDILWRNTISGGVGQFQMNNGVATWANIGWASTEWQAAGTGDFNGDGTSDILWRNAISGGVGQFQMNNGVATWANTGWASTEWQAAGTGDFNGDGTSDILWRNTTSGGVGQFQMDNGVATWANIGWASTEWQAAGTGDFNGDGTSDILWRNTITGGVGQFQMDNGVATWANIGWASTEWQVAGTGDFNGDGTSDILWHNSTTGGVGQFQMSNSGATWANIGWASTEWQTVQATIAV